MSDEIKSALDQPAPKHNNTAPLWPMVIADLKAHRFIAQVNDGGKLCSAMEAEMAERNATGTKRYGTPLQAFNGRNSTIDAYQEALDMVVYLKQSCVENPDNPVFVALYDEALDFAIRLRAQIQWGLVG